MEVLRSSVSGSHGAMSISIVQTATTGEADFYHMYNQDFHPL
jgi:hypothetical protein